MTYLLARASEALDKGEDPFTLQWMEANHMNLLEITQMTGLIAKILHGFTRASEEEQEHILSLSQSP